MAEHKQDEANVIEHQKTFEGFVNFWIYVFAGAIGVLIFLALFNS